MAIEALEKCPLSDVKFLRADEDWGQPVAVTSPIEDLIMRAIRLSLDELLFSRRSRASVIPEE